MALTRSFLRGLKLDDEQVSAIIEAHSETVDALKGVNAEMQKKLDEVTQKAENDGGWEKKYNDAIAEFDAYKTQTAQKEARALKESAYRALLKNAGVSEKRIEGILKYSADIIEKMELDEAGKAKNEADLDKAIKAEWADFITTSGTQGAKVDTPPAGDTGKAAFEKMTLAEKMAFANEHPSEYAAYTAK